jgi:uncharacterized membrane protein YeaQ/YmgE (transglycosylase-associated protein family)
MSNLVWVLLGLVSGLIVGKLVSNTGEGTIVDMLFGTGGAVVGGWLFDLFGGTGVTGVNIDSSYSVFAAVAGAIILLVLYHAVLRRRMR